MATVVITEAEESLLLSLMRKNLIEIDGQIKAANSSRIKSALNKRSSKVLSLMCKIRSKKYEPYTERELSRLLCPVGDPQ